MGSEKEEEGEKSGVVIIVVDVQEIKTKGCSAICRTIWIKEFENQLTSLFSSLFLILSMYFFYPFLAENRSRILVLKRILFYTVENEKKKEKV